MLPMPPNPERVELLGRKLGLTPAEARVAVLMQSGLTNREAAYRAGLKEQTFNTYAKRVLCKLNVTGRTEMAQLLTWQAAGRWTA
jgi:DNA-binding CsgD family transcriptional regulator